MLSPTQKARVFFLVQTRKNRQCQTCGSFRSWEKSEVTAKGKIIADNSQQWRQSDCLRWRWDNYLGYRRVSQSTVKFLTIVNCMSAHWNRKRFFQDHWLGEHSPSVKVRRHPASQETDCRVVEFRNHQLRCLGSGNFSVRSGGDLCR
jgi:hypothetical protein